MDTLHELDTDLLDNDAKTPETLDKSRELDTFHSLDLEYHDNDADILKYPVPAQK